MPIIDSIKTTIPTSARLRNNKLLTLMNQNSAPVLILLLWPSRLPYREISAPLTNPIQAPREATMLWPLSSVEFKDNNEPAKVREATHQIAVSSYVNLVERLRLRYNAKGSIHGAEDDKDIRHFAYTVCGT